MNRLSPLGTLGLTTTIALVASTSMARDLIASEAENSETFRLDFSGGEGAAKLHTPSDGAEKMLPGAEPRVDLGTKSITLSLAPGDEIEVHPCGPSRIFKGKKVTFDVLATIVEEVKECFKKIRNLTPYTDRNNVRGPNLELGQQVELRVEILHTDRIEPLSATFAKAATATLDGPATVRIRLVYRNEDVAFTRRAISSAETQKWVVPTVQEFQRRNPNYENVRSGSERVDPGDLASLSAEVLIKRSR